MAKIAVIGSGFSGLSSACYLSQKGHEVHVFEKNALPGGRARQVKAGDGYVFDMGPSWYWMPDVFEKFFQDFGHKASDFYKLELLDPSFDVVFSGGEVMHVPQNFKELCDMFERLEPGAGDRLVKFMEEAEFKYKTGIDDLVYKPGLSLLEFADLNLLKGVFKLQVFTSLSKHVRKFFSHPHLLALMEFPVLFLGAMPQDTPALYSLMNYAGLKLGTWYPQGGFGQVIEAFVSIAKKQGVVFHFDAPVEKILVEKDKATGLISNGINYSFDAILASADYHHVESKLLPPEKRNYSEDYWSKRTFAPSSLIFYLGINKKLEKLHHHTLFFDEDLYDHSVEIYKNPRWPAKPLFYACCPSKTDPSVAPVGHENLFLLMPIAPGLEDSEQEREKYFGIMMERLEKFTGESILPHIDFKRSYCVSDFVKDYNSYKGNAYGLANTLMQTANLKPKIKNFRIKNLYYAGQLTVPGPGVPPSIISGKVSAGLIHQQLKKVAHEIDA
jgi:phytoene desaturase